LRIIYVKNSLLIAVWKNGLAKHNFELNSSNDVIILKLGLSKIVEVSLASNSKTLEESTQVQLYIFYCFLYKNLRAMDLRGTPMRPRWIRLCL